MILAIQLLSSILHPDSDNQQVNKFLARICKNSISHVEFMEPILLYKF